MEYINGSLILSPSDVIRFLDGNFAAWMDRLHVEPGGMDTCQPDKPSEEDKLIQSYGDRHEKAHLAALKQQGPVTEIDRKAPNARELTLAAMRRGDPVIYQAALEADPFRGFADFLHRIEGSSALGDWHYEPWDTKLARKVKPYFIVQLCAYAEMLEAVQGRRPSRAGAILGNGDMSIIPIPQYWYAWRHLRQAFLDFQAAFDRNAMPDPGLERNHGEWSEYAERLLLERDHPSQVAGITLSQVLKLKDAGVASMASLAASTGTVDRMQPATLDRLRRQARLQIASIGKNRPEIEVLRPEMEKERRGLQLLPPASPGDVYFDLEGFPLFKPNGLDYLFGAVIPAEGDSAFVHWWAHDEPGEKSIFEAFVDWAIERRRRHPEMHIYHYAAYEETALKRLMGKYATREGEVDELLRSGTLVDLYTVVRQGLAIGTPSYSLKDVEHCYGFCRSSGVTTADGSMVAYEAWLMSGETVPARDPAILERIRAYNEEDCRSTEELATWLRYLQLKHGIPFKPEPESEKELRKKAAESGRKEKERPGENLASELLGEVQAEAPSAARDEKELLAWLLQFHRRESKPAWWKMFYCADQDEETLVHNRDCLAGLVRTARPAFKVDNSKGYEFSFDLAQETKLTVGDKARIAHDLSLPAVTITELDPANGLVVIKTTASEDKFQARNHLIPGGPVNTDALADAVFRFVTSWRAKDGRFPAILDLVRCQRPRLKGSTPDPLVDESLPLLPQVSRLVQGLDSSLLAVQGPPGTGKTYTAGVVIADLLKQGKRVGVTANSHKVILNILASVAKALKERGVTARVLKAGGEDEDLPTGVEHIGKNEEIGEALQDGVVVGATAWGFARPDLEQAFDYLFVDEAGQFCLANAIAVGTATRNLILIGDQMQLPQPVQANHPGQSGRSALEFVLGEHATIQKDFGVLLNVSWRMHPGICDWVSAAVYEERLRPEDANKRIRIELPREQPFAGRLAGILHVPVVHTGNVQSSEQEAAEVEAIARGLVGCRFTDREGVERNLAWNDILIVAPYNLQVRLIQQRLPEARVGSVDLFQGQEAPVAILSMCASSPDEVSRGTEFLLSPNRLNVAVSRAQALSIVVSSPALLGVRCRSVEEMQRVNTLCWLVEYSNG